MYDVIVVSAGSAGNNVAYRMASSGFSVAVVDWRQRIGDKLCTGIVGRECLQRFPIDRSLVFRDARSATVTAPGGETVDFVTEDVQAHVVDRVSYVASFAERAREAGAHYYLGCRVTEVSTTPHAVVQYTDEHEKRSLEGRALVLASGFGSELTGQLGLGKVGDYVTGVQAEVLAPEVNGLQVYFGRGVAPGFFAWLTPTRGGRALAGLLSRSHGQSYLENLVRRLQEEGKITEVIKSPARWGIPLRPLPRSHGERVLVVGDAAGQVKPTTGGGIYYSLVASDVAAETLRTALIEDNLSASSLSYYEKSWRSALSKELEVGYSARRIFEGLRGCFQSVS